MSALPKVFFEPQRPNLPINGQPLEVWRENPINEIRLLRYFRDLDPDEWDRKTRLCYSLQKISEEQKFMTGRDLL